MKRDVALAGVAGLFAVLAGVGCGEDGDRTMVERAQLAVTGTVRDSISQSTLQGAEVLLHSAVTTVSDSAGAYWVVVGFTLEDETLTFRKQGYKSRAFPLDTAAAPDSSRTDIYVLNVQLPPE